MVVAASSMFAVLRADAEALEMRRQMWADLHAKDVKMAKRLGRHPLVLASNLSSSTGRKLSVKLYRLAQRIYRFS